MKKIHLRDDLVWVLIPLSIPLILFLLTPDPDDSARLTVPAVCLLLPVCVYLTLRGCSVLIGFNSAFRIPHSALISAASLIAALFVIHFHLEAFLQALFILFFATLLILTLTHSAFRIPHSAFKNSAFSAYFRLTKPALSAMVLVSVLMGYRLASPGPLDWARVARTLIGAALCSGAAAALNQYLERAADSAMARTAGRPLPAGRLAPPQALAFGAALALAGMALLALTVNLATAFLATLSFAVYILIYTPLKRVSPLATLAGGVSGALPPLLGWFGAGGALTPGALVLFCILYLWQIPHFLAIGWKYREQYRFANFRLYTALDASGRLTGLQALLYATVLLPVSLMMSWHGLAGQPYMLGAFALGISLIAFSAAFALRPTPAPTRCLFLASIGYLPLLLLFMMLDRWLGL